MCSDLEAALTEGGGAQREVEAPLWAPHRRPMGPSYKLEPWAEYILQDFFTICTDPCLEFRSDLNDGDRKYS